MCSTGASSSRRSSVSSRRSIASPGLVPRALSFEDSEFDSDLRNGTPPGQELQEISSLLEGQAWRESDDVIELLTGAIQPAVDERSEALEAVSDFGNDGTSDDPCIDEDREGGSGRAPEGSSTFGHFQGVTEDQSDLNGAPAVADEEVCDETDQDRAAREREALGSAPCVVHLEAPFRWTGQQFFHLHHLHRE